MRDEKMKAPDRGLLPWTADKLTEAAGRFFEMEKKRGGDRPTAEFFMWFRESYNFDDSVTHLSRFMKSRDLINQNLPRLVREGLAAVKESGQYALSWSLMQALATSPFTHHLHSDFFDFALEEVIAEAKRLALESPDEAPPI